MKAPVRFLEPGAVYMGVDLRRRNIGVAEHRLQGAQIGAAFEQMGSEGMAQRMGCHALFDAGSEGVIVNQFPESLARERLAGASDKQKRAGPPLLQQRANFAQITEQLFSRPLAKGHGPHLGTFAFDRQIVALKIDLLGLQ